MRVYTRVFAGLHQTEMPFRQAEFAIAHHGASDRHARLFDGRTGQVDMPLAARPIDHDAGDLDLGIVMPEADRDSRCRLALAGDVKHQEHGYAQQTRQIRSRTGASLATGNAIEKAHGAFNQQQLVIVRRLLEKMRHQIGLHGPAV